MYCARFKVQTSDPLNLKTFIKRLSDEKPEIVTDKISVIVRTLARMKLTSDIFSEVDANFKTFKLPPNQEEEIEIFMTVRLISFLI